jgi:hypothetical protein
VSQLDVLLRAHRDVDLVEGSPEFWAWVLERQIARAFAAIVTGCHAGSA